MNIKEVKNKVSKDKISAYLKSALQSLRESILRKKDSLVIEYGDISIKVALFSFTNSRVKVEKIWVKEVSKLKEQEKEKIFCSIIKDNFSVQVLKNLRTFFLIPEKNFTVRRTTLPLMPIHELDAALKFKLKDEVSFDIEKTNYCWKIIGQKKDSDGFKKLDLMISFLSREKLESIRKLCKKANLVCYGVFSQFLSLTNLINILNIEKTVLVLDIGAVNTYLMIFRKNLALFLRKIPFGASQLNKAIKDLFKNTDMSLDEVENIKKEYGLMGTDNKITKGITAQDLFSSMRSGLEKLTAEIRKSIEFYISEYEDVKIEKIFLLGGGSQLKNLDKILSTELETEVLRFPVLPNVEVGRSLDKDMVCASLPTLLAAIFERSANYLPKEFRVSELEEIEGPLLRVGIPVLCLLYLVLFLNVNFQNSSYAKRLEYAKFHLGELKDIKELKEETKKREALLTKLKKSYIPADWVMKSISTTLPPEILLEKVFISQRDKMVSFEGYLTDINSADEILTGYAKKLRIFDIFDEVNLVNIIKTAKESRDVVMFKINCKLIQF